MTGCGDTVGMRQLNLTFVILPLALPRQLLRPLLISQIQNEGDTLGGCSIKECGTDEHSVLDLIFIAGGTALFLVGVA